MVLRSLIFSVLALAGACSPPAPQGTATDAASQTTTAADPGQAMAIAAGRDLIGARAPTLRLRTIDGDVVDLGSLVGRRPIYLKFWATWCVPCREQMGHFERSYRELGGDIAVVAINTGFNDSQQAIEDYRREVQLTMPIVIDDGRLAEALHLRVTPQHVVIGRDGRILYVGHLADAQLDAALRAAIAGAAADVAQENVARSPSTMAIHVGDSAPTQAITTIADDQITLRDSQARRPTALVFFTPWCESYLAESRPADAANCQRVREQTAVLSGRSDIRFVGIASGLWVTRDDVGAYRRDHTVNFPLILDASGQLFRDFGVSAAPTVILISRDGRIVRRIGPDESDLGDAIQALIRS